MFVKWNSFVLSRYFFYEQKAAKTVTRTNEGAQISRLRFFANLKIASSEE
jgi:hypothetical protein